MQRSAFPSRSYDEAQRNLFDELIRRLLNGLKEKVVPRGPDVDDDDRFIPSGEALEYFEVCNNARDAVKRICQLTLAGSAICPDTSAPTDTLPNGATRFITGSQAEDAVARIESSVNQMDNEEAFWHAIIGQDIENGEPDDARARILSILIFVGVSIDSHAWQTFFFLTMYGGYSGEERFCDRLLSTWTSRKKVRAIFGDDRLSDSIYLEQYRVRPLAIDGKKEIWVGEEALLIRLPVLICEPIHNIRSNLQSKVSRVKYHQLQYSGRSKSGWVVQKIVNRGTSDVRILSQLAKNHEISGHIVEIQAIIHFHEKIIIIMEPAEGDLRELLLNSDKLFPDIFRGGKTRMLRRLLGIAKGLKLLHEGIKDPESDCRMVVVHADIRPQNILLFKDDGGEIIFKIADFDISFLGESSDNTRFANPRQGGDCDCRPPEGSSKIQLEGRRVTSAYDVYAFGALICICLAWLWGGPGERQNFEEMRFNTPFKGSGLYPNDGFFSVHSGQECFSGNNHSGHSEKLHVKLNTHDLSVDATIQENEGVLKYFEGIRRGNDRPGERAFIWEAFMIVKKHCLRLDSAKRSKIGLVDDLLYDLVSQY